jgi:hypothetical protein
MRRVGSRANKPRFVKQMPDPITNTAIGLLGALLLALGAVKGAQAINRHFSVDVKHG